MIIFAQSIKYWCVLSKIQESGFLKAAEALQKIIDVETDKRPPAAKVPLDSDEEEEYSFDEVLKAVKQNVKEKEEKDEPPKAIEMDLSSAQALIANLMGHFGMGSAQPIPPQPVAEAPVGGGLPVAAAPPVVGTLGAAAGSPVAGPFAMGLPAVAAASPAVVPPPAPPAGLMPVIQSVVSVPVLAHSVRAVEPTPELSDDLLTAGPIGKRFSTFFAGHTFLRNNSKTFLEIV